MALFFFFKKFERDPNQKQPADELQSSSPQQKRGDCGEANPQHNGGSASNENSLLTLPQR